MPTIEDALKALEALEGGADLVSAVKGELTKRNNENQNLRKRAKAAEDSQKSLKEAQEKLYDILGLSTDDIEADDFDLEKSLEDFKNKQGGKKADSPEFAELQKKVTQLTRTVDKLTKENTEFKSTAETERTKRIDMAKTDALLKALTAGKAIKPDIVAKMLAGSIKVNDEDKLVYVNEAGEELSVDEGVKAFLGANQEFVINAQLPGAGSQNGGPGGKTDPAAYGKELAEARNKGAAPETAGGYNPWAPKQ